MLYTFRKMSHELVIGRTIGLCEQSKRARCRSRFLLLARILGNVARQTTEAQPANVSPMLQTTLTIAAASRIAQRCAQLWQNLHSEDDEWVQMLYPDDHLDSLFLECLVENLSLVWARAKARDERHMCLALYAIAPRNDNAAALLGLCAPAYEAIHIVKESSVLDSLLRLAQIYGVDGDMEELYLALDINPDLADILLPKANTRTHSSAALPSATSGHDIQTWRAKFETLKERIAKHESHAVPFRAKTNPPMQLSTIAIEPDYRGLRVDSTRTQSSGPSPPESATGLLRSFQIQLNPDSSFSTVGDIESIPSQTPSHIVPYLSFRMVRDESSRDNTIYKVSALVPFTPLGSLRDWLDSPMYSQVGLPPVLAAITLLPVVSALQELFEKNPRRPYQRLSSSKILRFPDGCWRLSECGLYPIESLCGVTKQQLSSQVTNMEVATIQSHLCFSLAQIFCEMLLGSPSMSANSSALNPQPISLAAIPRASAIHQEFRQFLSDSFSLKTNQQPSLSSWMQFLCGVAFRHSASSRLSQSYGTTKTTLLKTKSVETKNREIVETQVFALQSLSPADLAHHLSRQHVPQRICNIISQEHIDGRMISRLTPEMFMEEPFRFTRYEQLRLNDGLEVLLKQEKDRVPLNTTQEQQGSDIATINTINDGAPLESVYPRDTDGIIRDRLDEAHTLRMQHNRLQEEVIQLRRHLHTRTAESENHHALHQEALREIDELRSTVEKLHVSLQIADGTFTPPQPPTRPRTSRRKGQNGLSDTGDGAYDDDDELSATERAYRHPRPYIISGGEDKSLCIWDLCHPKGWALVNQRTGAHDQGITCTSIFHPGGANQTNGDEKGGDRQGQEDANRTDRVPLHYADDLRILTSGSDGRVRMWPVIDRKPPQQKLQQPERREMWEASGHQQTVYSVCQVAGLVATAGYDRTVRLWSAPRDAIQPSGVESKSGTGGLQPEGNLVGHEAAVLSLCSLDVTGHGEWLASGGSLYNGSDAGIRLWDPRTQQGLGLMTGHKSHVKALASCRPPGQHSDTLLSASGSFYGDKTVRVWDPRTASAGLCFRGHVLAVNTCCHLPGTHYIASGSEDRTIRIWDLRTSTEVRTVKGHTWNVSCLLPVTLPYNPRAPTQAPDQDLSPSAPIQALISASYDKTISVWHAESGRQLACLTGHSEAILSLASFTAWPIDYSLLE